MKSKRVVFAAGSTCGMVIVGTEGERLKSGVEIASFAILFDPDSATQVLPELSTTTSCGALAAIVHSVNWPLGTPVFGFVAGVTATRALPAGLGGVATRAPGTGANGVTVGEPPPEIVPPLEGSSSRDLACSFLGHPRILSCCTDADNSSISA